MRMGDRGGWVAAAALVVILLGAASARFIDLPSNPGGLNPDEAAEAVAGRQILRDPSYRPVFIIEDAGREALFAYTLAAGFAVGGDNVVTLRAVSAIWGVLGVLGAWLIGRRFGRGAGLAAAAWAAGSLWLIAISRDGMRNTFTPFFCASALVVLLAWYERPTRRMAVFTGAVLALSTLYTYQALKLLPFLVLIWVLWVRRIDLTTFQRMWRTGPWLIGSFLVVGAPMIAFAISDPQNYLGRAIGVSAFNPAIVPEADLVTHTLRTLGMFAFVGDPNARHDVGALPMLSWPLVTLIVVGLVALWRHRGDARHALVLLSFPVFLIPPLLSIEGGSPHFLRALGLAIPVAVTVALGAQQVRSWLVARLATGGLRVRAALSQAAAATAVGAVFLVLGVSSTWTYLDRPAADRQGAFRYDLVAMAELAAPTDTVIASEFDAFTIRYIHDDPQPAIVRPGQVIEGAAAERVLAVRVEDLRTALGGDLASRALPVAWDGAGQPIVWAVTLR